MAAKGRGADSPLERILLDEGFRFDFFQAVRLLTRIMPYRQGLAREAPPVQEIVRFHTHLSLSFPPSAIYELKRAESAEGPLQMTVAFMGLTGTMGALPRHYTEWIMERLRAKDRALLDFLDLFNHRLISLFYRAWEKHHFPVGYEAAVVKGKEEDRFSQYLFALIGLGTKGVRGRLALRDRSLLVYSGILAQHPRSACALEQCLEDYFEVTVRVHQFVGEWLPLPAEDYTRLGGEAGTSALGTTALAGTEVWDQHARFQVRLGPLSHTAFSRMLPVGKAYVELVQLVRFFVGQQFDFDVRPLLKAEEVPWCCLEDTPAYTPRLGWSTWLKTQEFVTDAEDVVFAGV